MKAEAKQKKKNPIRSLVIILGAFFAFSLMAGSDLAHARGKRCKKQIPAIPIRCGDTIGPGERVYLDQDLDCSADLEGPALTVEGPVTLDLRNHTITGNGNNDVILVTGTEARIKRGTVTGGSVGIVVAGEGNHRIIKIRSVDNAEDGFIVESSHNRLVFNRALDNGYKGYDITGPQNWLVKCRAENNGDEGINIDSDENKIFMCSSSNNERENIEIKGNLNRVFHNVSKESKDRGIDVEGNENIVYRNRALNNDEHGITVDGDANRILKNRSFDNAQHGIQVEWGNIDNVVRRNWAKNNGHDVLKKGLYNSETYFDLFDEAGLDADGNFESNTTWSKNRYGTKNLDAIE